MYRVTVSTPVLSSFVISGILFADSSSAAVFRPLTPTPYTLYRLGIFFTDWDAKYGLKCYGEGGDLQLYDTSVRGQHSM